MHSSLGRVVLAVLVSCVLPTICRADDLAPSGYTLTAITTSSPERGAPPEPSPGPSMNANGDVAFVISEHGKDTLFLRYAMGVTIPVVAAGDALAGSTVARLVLMPTSLDAYRQILFWAALADGRTGLFRATPAATPYFVSPTFAYRDRPTTFRLTGDGFVPGMQVRFGSVQAGFLTIVSRTEVAGVIPEGAPVGPAELTVVTPGGATRTLPRPFEFRDPPESGCRGWWSDHRPPVARAPGLPSDLLVVCGAVAWLHGSRRRRR